MISTLDTGPINVISDEVALTPTKGLFPAHSPLVDCSYPAISLLVGVILFIRLLELERIMIIIVE
jgi:hypothetical protein